MYVMPDGNTAALERYEAEYARSLDEQERRIEEKEEEIRDYVHCMMMDYAGGAFCDSCGDPIVHLGQVEGTYDPGYDKITYRHYCTTCWAETLNYRRRLRNKFNALFDKGKEQIDG